MNLDLPKELYICILCLADDVSITKSLRSVSKKAYTASYDYFKLLLKQPIFIHHVCVWHLSNEVPDFWMNEDYLLNGPSHGHGNNANTPNRSMCFKTTVHSLYDTFNRYL